LDDLGNRLTVTDGNNATVSYSYDELSRVHSKVDAGTTSIFTYDRSPTDFSMGRLASVTERALTTSLKYDPAGRVAERSRVLGTGNSPFAIVVDYFWDFLGRPQAKVMGNTTVGYLYPDGRNLREVQVNGQTFATFSSYDANRLAQSRITPASATTMFRDARGILTDLSTTSSTGAVLQNVHLVNDVSGFTHTVTDQRSDKTESWPEQSGTVSVNTDESVSFTYDADNRLQSATSPLWGSLIYGYDPEGNLLQKGSVTFSPNGKQIVAYSGSTSIATANLDSAGNRTTLDDRRGHTIYSYNNDHQLESANLTTSAGTVLVSFFNDYEGARVEKTIRKPTGEAIVTLYNDGIERRLSTTQATASSTTVHVAAPGVGAIATITTGSIPGEPDLGVPLIGTTSWVGDTITGPAVGTVFYVSNWMGSASVMTDSAGNFEGRIMYQPFGEMMSTDIDPHSQLVSVGRDVATPKFSGKELDEETNLTYFGARYYDSAFGRFITADSEIPGNGSFPQGFNRYAYAFNNPVKLFDPDGHEPFPNVESNYYFAEGPWLRSYNYYAGIVGDSRYGALTRTGAVLNAALVFTPAAVEELGRGIANIFHYADMGGQLAARASQEKNVFAKVDDYSASVADFSTAFGNSLIVAAPLAKAAPAPIPAATVAPIIANGARGVASEARVLAEMGLTKNTTAVSTAEGVAIPDALTDALSVEVKDRASVSLTQQLRIQTQAAKASGRQSVLVTGTNTDVSGPAKKAFDIVIRRDDLGPPSAQ
ncbi:MAG TPA: RHS repeat-associated core domain-containing protein, partial [Polyangia bacterium]